MPASPLTSPPGAVLSAVRRSVVDLLLPAASGAYRDLRRPSARLAPAEVPRTDFDPTVPANIIDPYPELARIREHPVVVNEQLGVWMLGRHQDVHAAVRDNETFTSRDGIVMRSFGVSVVAFVDPPDHTRLRHIASPLFNKRSIQTLESDIRDLAAEGVAELKSGAIVDLVSALTIPMPVNVIARILGIPRDQWPAFRAASDKFAQGFGPTSLLETARLLSSSLPAYVQLRSFIDTEMLRRAAAPAEDFLTRLQQARAAGELTDGEAFLYALILLVAGNETTTNLLGILLMTLAGDQKLFDELKADRSLLPAAVEETVRFGSPVQWVTRTAVRDHRIHGVRIPRGARVVLFYASANRDPDRFSDPDRFDIHRDPTGHLGFGHGLHFCLGAHLARLEVITAINHLLDEVDGLEMAGPVRWTTTPSLRGPASLPVRARQSRA